MEFTSLDQQIKQNQKLNMSLLMKRSFLIMQMNNLELKEFLLSEIEKNPILRIKENYHFSTNSHNEKNDSYFSIKYRPSLFEHLLKQAKEVFNTKEQLLIAENIIGNLDKKGYFTHDLDELIKELNVHPQHARTILEIIKSFDPKGIAAKNLQERLLLQIINKKSLEYKIIDRYFDDILKNRFSKIAKNLQIHPEIIQRKVEKVILNANFDPTLDFIQTPTSNAINPDIIIKKIGKNWIIEIEEDIPIFEINSYYVQVLENQRLNSSTKYLFSARLLMKNIIIRRKTLHEIAIHIIQKQRLFLLGKSNLEQMTIQEIARELNLHPSTLLRTLSNKYIETPIGLFSMKSFFSNIFKKAKTIKPIEQAIRDTISKEDKSHPLSDDMITNEIKKQGFNLRRRTIAKYRKKLLIGSSFQRKKFY